MLDSYRSIPVVALLGLLLASCQTPVDPNAEPASVSWQRAVDLVNTHKVEQVFQTHALLVALVLKDGTTVQTVEPTIDDIIRVIRNCGQPCTDIAVATE